jgi:hypothetical protein
MIRLFCCFVLLGFVCNTVYSEDKKYTDCAIQKVGRTVYGNKGISLNFNCKEKDGSINPQYCFIRNDNKICNNEAGGDAKPLQYVKKVKNPCAYPYTDNPKCSCVFGTMDLSDASYDIEFKHKRNKIGDCKSIKITNNATKEVISFKISD